MAELNPETPIGFFDDETKLRYSHGQQVKVGIASGLQYTRPDGQRKLTWEDAPMHEENKARLRGFIALLFPEDYIKQSHPRLVVERLIERVEDADDNVRRLFLSPVLRGRSNLGIDQVLIRGPMGEYSLGNADEGMMEVLIAFSDTLAHVVSFDMDEEERHRVAARILGERAVFHIGMMTREMWDMSRATHAAGADAASD